MKIQLGLLLISLSVGSIEMIKRSCRDSACLEPGVKLKTFNIKGLDRRPYAKDYSRVYINDRKKKKHYDEEDSSRVMMSDTDRKYFWPQESDAENSHPKIPDTNHDRNGFLPDANEGKESLPKQPDTDDDDKESKPYGDDLIMIEVPGNKGKPPPKQPDTDDDDKESIPYGDDLIMIEDPGNKGKPLPKQPEKDDDDKDSTPYGNDYIMIPEYPGNKGKPPPKQSEKDDDDKESQPYGDDYIMIPDDDTGPRPYGDDHIIVPEDVDNKGKPLPTQPEKDDDNDTGEQPYGNDYIMIPEYKGRGNGKQPGKDDKQKGFGPGTREGNKKPFPKEPEDEDNYPFGIPVKPDISGKYASEMYVPKYFTNDEIIEANELEQECDIRQREMCQELSESCIGGAAVECRTNDLGIAYCACGEGSARVKSAHWIWNLFAR